MMHFQDSETGEINYSTRINSNNSNNNNNNHFRSIDYDEETGEPIRFKSSLNINNTNGNNNSNQNNNIKTSKFYVPRHFLKIQRKPSYEKRIFKYCKETYTLTDKHKVINLKEEIILGYNKKSHRMFLIPSLIFFTKLTAVFISIVEILLHIWAHRKNSKNDNQNIYYRSPLHILTSQFCAICRAEAECNHVGKLQQDRLKKLQINFKQLMTKSLS